jgi:hypothetical protein
MPFEWVAISQAAQNHTPSGSFEPCSTVPAVTEVCLPQPAHSQVNALVDSSHPLPCPHTGHRKPPGQRAAVRYAAQARSSRNRRWNSNSERGKSDMIGAPGDNVRLPFYSIAAALSLHLVRPERGG